MATETVPSHQTPTSDHQTIGTKMTEEAKSVEPETVSLAKKTEEEEEEEEEEDLKPNELASQPTPLPKPEEEVEDKEAEPPAIEVKKIDDVPVVDVPVDDKKELEKDSISDSHTPSVPAPVADVVNGESVASAIESVPKEAEEQPLSTSVEELPQEEPKIFDVPVLLEEAIEKPHEPSEVLPIKESEAKDTEDEALSKGVDDGEPIIPEVEVKIENQSQVGKQVEEAKTEEAVEQPEEPWELLPVKSEAVVVEDTEDSQPVSKEDDKPESESIVPEVEVKSEEQSEVIKEVEPVEKSVEVIAETQEPVEVLPIKESEAVQVKDIDGAQELSKEAVEAVVPEPKEVKLDSEGTENVGKREEQSVETIEKTQDSSEVHPIKESDVVPVKDIDDSVVVLEVDKPEPVVPELVQVKEKEQSEVTEQTEKPEPVVPELVQVKEKEQSEVTEQIEKPETVVPEVQVKEEAQSEVTEQIEKPEPVVPDVQKEEKQSEVTEQIQKPETVVPEVQVKEEEQSEVTKHIEKPESVVPETDVKLTEPREVTKLDENTEEHEVEVKPEGKSEASEQVELKPTDEKPGEVAAVTQEAQVEIIEDGGKSSLPEIVEKAASEDEKKEAEGTDLAEVSSKEVLVEPAKGGEEKEAEPTKAECEKIASDTPKEELAQPIKVEDVSNAVSNAEFTEKSLEGEKTVESAEPAVENKKELIPAIDETKKDENVEGKLDEDTKTVSEPITESQDSELEAKEEEETAKTSEENSEQEKVDKIAESDTQNLESSAKEAEDTKVSQDLPREVPAKPTQKQSNNILTKVKQSLVKAKKAIIGKSPTPKTVSSDTKG